MGTVKRPAIPVGMSENLRLLEGEMYPSKTMWLLWTMVPTTAIMAMRPCFLSTARRRSKASGSEVVMVGGGIGGVGRGLAAGR